MTAQVVLPETLNSPWKSSQIVEVWEPAVVMAATAVLGTTFCIARPSIALRRRSRRGLKRLVQRSFGDHSETANRHTKAQIARENGMYKQAKKESEPLLHEKQNFDHWCYSQELLQQPIHCFGSTTDSEILATSVQRVFLYPRFHKQEESDKVAEKCAFLSCFKVLSLGRGCWL